MDKKTLARLWQANTPEEALALAKREKLPVTEAEIRERFARAAGSELTDSELEDVAGGKTVIILP